MVPEVCHKFKHFLLVCELLSEKSIIPASGLDLPTIVGLCDQNILCHVPPEGIEPSTLGLEVLSLSMSEALMGGPTPEDAILRR